MSTLKSQRAVLTVRTILTVETNWIKADTLVKTLEYKGTYTQLHAALPLLAIQVIYQNHFQIAQMHFK